MKATVEHIIKEMARELEIAMAGHSVGDDDQHIWDGFEELINAILNDHN